MKKSIITFSLIVFIRICGYSQTIQISGKDTFIITPSKTISIPGTKQKINGNVKDRHDALKSEEANLHYQITRDSLAYIKKDLANRELLKKVTQERKDLCKLIKHDKDK